MDLVRKRTRAQHTPSFQAKTKQEDPFLLPNGGSSPPAARLQSCQIPRGRVARDFSRAAAGHPSFAQRAWRWAPSPPRLPSEHRPPSWGLLWGAGYVRLSSEGGTVQAQVTRCHGGGRGSGAAADRQLRRAGSRGGAGAARGRPGRGGGRRGGGGGGGGGRRGGGTAAPQGRRAGPAALPPPASFPPAGDGRASWRAANFTAPRSELRLASGAAGGGAGRHRDPSPGSAGRARREPNRAGPGRRAARPPPGDAALWGERAAVPRPGRFRAASAAPWGGRRASGRLSRGTPWARRSPTPRGRAAPRRPAPGGTTARTTCCSTRSRARRAPCRPTPSTPCESRRPGPGGSLPACAGAERAGRRAPR